MKRTDFCAFILTHGRPNNVITYDLLRKRGYTGEIFLIVDNEDSCLAEYFDIYGDHVIVFNKPFIGNTFDTCDNFENRKTIIYARNACFSIAKELGYRYFVELDDDYYYFGIRDTEGGACKISDLDSVFSLFLDYLESSPIKTIAFSQGGDHVGGFSGNLCKRKAMNSFICSIDKPFTFIGRINEDVNTYVYRGGLGDIFLTVMNVQLDQKDTQSNKGGMTETYIDGGTYLKSFYTVMINPSCVKVKVMGTKGKRLHHSVSWENAAPCIINEKYKK